jgi:hypothetical protein
MAASACGARAIFVNMTDVNVSGGKLILAGGFVEVDR